MIDQRPADFVQVKTLWGWASAEEVRGVNCSEKRDGWTEDVEEILKPRDESWAANLPRSNISGQGSETPILPLPKCSSSSAIVMVAAKRLDNRCIKSMHAATIRGSS